MKQSLKEIETKYSQFIRQSNDQLLATFHNLPCPAHPNRPLDQICTLKACREDQILFCSNCNVQSDQAIAHVKAHKSSVIELEKYLPQRIQQLIGLDLMTQEESAQDILTRLETQIQEKSEATLKQVCLDYDQILEYVTSLVRELQQKTREQLEKYQQVQMQQIKQKREAIKEYRLQLNKEQLIILADLQDSLSQVDKTKNKNVNKFIKKLREKNHTYQVQTQLEVARQEVERIEQDFHHTPFYDSAQTTRLKELLHQEIELKLKQDRFVQLAPLRQDVLLETMVPAIQGHPHDPRCFTIHPSLDKVSIQSLRTVKTQHRTAINALAQYGPYIITNGNDHIVTFQYNNQLNQQLFEQNRVVLDDLCTALKVVAEEEVLLLGLNNGRIDIRDIKNIEQQVPLSKSFSFHQKQVKSIEYLHQHRAMVSAGYDEHLFIWNLEGLLAKVPKIEGKLPNKLFNPRLSSLSHDQNMVYYGNKAGDFQVVRVTQEAATLSLQQHNPIRLFTERITQIVSSRNGQGLLYIANDGGKIIICSYEEDQNKVRLLDQIYSNRSCIYGLVLVEKEGEDRYLVQLVWDQKVQVVDLKSQKSVSSVFHQLKNDPKKHFNSQGTQLQLFAFGETQQNIMTTCGNNDTSVQMFSLTFS